MIKAYELEGFVEGVHQPYTDYNREIIDWLCENSDREHFGKDDFIFTQCTIRGGYSFYTNSVVISGDIYYTNDQFKKWIGMEDSKVTNKQDDSTSVNPMPELIAGRHFVKFENGRYAMIMDGYINYVELGKYSCDIRIVGFDNINILNRYSYIVVEVYDPHESCSHHFNKPDIESGEYTVWKKQDQKTLNLKKELESCEAKMERLQKHMDVLKSKLS